MRLVEIEDLEVGDEIAIACQSYFKYLKVLRKPAPNGKTLWNSNKPAFKTVKCSTRRVDTPYTYTSWSGNTITRTKKEWEFTPDDHNLNTYVDLNCRHILLIKKADENV
jgi:hypothetical protein